MAFSGFHVIAAYAGASMARDKSQSILGEISRSESPSSGVSTTNVSPAINDATGQPFFRIRGVADSWVSIGKSPNASANPRIRVPANTDYDIFAEPGDKLQWVAA